MRLQVRKHTKCWNWVKKTKNLTTALKSSILLKVCPYSKVGLIVFISTLYRNQLVSTDACNENMVSYGVRNSIAAYLSFAGDQDPSRVKSDNRKKKSKSLYVLPENGLPNTDYDEDF